MENTNYKILLIEDDKIDQMAFKRFILNEQLPYEIVVSGSITEAQAVLSSEKFDIIISDFSLGDGTALDILDLVKDIPIILTTGARDEEVAVKAWKAGAYDYLAKDDNMEYLKILPKTIENVIKRKKIEDALDRKQKNLLAIFDAVPVGLFSADENLIITRVNEAIKNMFHKEYVQIIGKKIGDALGCTNAISNENGCGSSSECTVCLLRKSVKDVLENNNPIHNIETCPTLCIDNEQRKVWLRVSVVPTMIDNSKHVIVAVDDINERKNAEQERRLAEEKYRTIFQNSAVAITMADEQERIVSWNKFAENLLGMDYEDLYLKPLKSLYPSEEWERIRNFRVREKGMQHSLETKLTTKDGRVIDVNVSLSVLKNENEETIGSIGVITDITERKQAEEKLKETMELKSQFISTVSHELRTPMAAMKEAIEIVLDGIVGDVNEKQKKFLTIAKRNVDRLGALINDVLDFQKLEAGKMNLDLQQNDIRQFISEVHETMVLFAGKNKVELAMELDDDLQQADFDKSKMTQVLTNLLSNSIKFTPADGKVTMKAFYRREHADGNPVEIAFSISDTGMGIPKEALAKIFDRFYRVKREGKQIQGTGLGLAIVNKIIILHGGRIDVESEVEKGTTFTVYLPLMKEASSEKLSIKTDERVEKIIA
ncbi:MAG: PAS domain S-box protein [Sedimentisphaerales bacterium]|nr:PAS domain S-box protein [Sedimentisphaerales bacterium]